jgi:uncharacterized membrane protein YeaQ/YmgE (transglycosylase-associated protein family)
MLNSTWLLLTGIIVGLLVRHITDDRAYGAIADCLLGITGAFAAEWLIEAMRFSGMVARNERLVVAIWTAAALPALVRFVAKHRRRQPSPSRPTSLSTKWFL